MGHPEFDFGSYRVKDGIATVTIDRPHVLNALGHAHHHELSAIWDGYLADESAKVAVITGSGTRAFCAGYDLTDATTEPGRFYWQLDGPNGFGGLAQRPPMDKPVIAAVNGHAIGGGFALALSCHLIVSSRDATFGMPEPTMGLPSTFGALERLAQQIPTKQALELVLTCDRITAEEGYRFGFVNKVVAPGDVHNTAQALATRIAALPSAAVRTNLQAMSGAASLPLEVAVRHVYPATAQLWESEDFRTGTGVDSFLSKDKNRDPHGETE